MGIRVQIIRLILLIVAVLSVASSYSAYGQAKQKHGTVHGRIINVVGLPLANAEIYFESKFEFYNTKTDSNGNYSIKMYPTTYRVTTGAWIGPLGYPITDPLYEKDCRSYFRSSNRASFRLQIDQVLEINFVLAEIDCVYNEVENQSPNERGTFSNPTDLGTEARTRYETLYFPNDEFKDDLDLVIQFGNRGISNGIVEYLPATGYRIFCDSCLPFVLGNPFPGVIITYDNMTFYAVKATFNARIGRLEATEGKIIVENGSRRYEIKKLIINLSKKKVELQMF